ncbi:hypothetical protein PYW08_006565 [Mythimna loreyi]|uniref:Uncharacterized protein n=1 Tax=Mythimna loreyi TaxID=667449 RepID=A0ACC2QNJ5_9NEOP|nr:hypothetical protein PYW08_006565 [Mythimna loreyi]
MTMSDLILFALGIYQIKQARSYFGEYIRRNGSFVVELYSETMVPGTLSSHESILIRGRIKSRHHSNKIYYTYILISARQDNWENSIEGYYCSCICGIRTVGCCAHVMTIVWYLGWARHQNNVVAPASFLDDILIREEE